MYGFSNIYVVLFDCPKICNLCWECEKKVMKFEASENAIINKRFSQNEMKLVGRLGC